MFHRSMLAVLALGVAIVVVYLRVFGAGYVEMDDGLHVHANPFLNPLSFGSAVDLWRHAYQGLYIPLAYTILAGISLFARVPAQTMDSIGRTVILGPAAFHVASIAIHAANSALCFVLALRLTRNQKTALLCASLFALHPLQVESVAWISELRGLTSGGFALVALNLFVVSRQLGDRAPAKSRALLVATTLLVIGAMLCKPAAVVLPLVLLAIDRVAQGTSWRRALLTASAVLICLLPAAWVTRSVQTVHPLGASLWWQRPFIAGEALAFYLVKTVAPVGLGIKHGRTPSWVMSHPSSYVAWLLPAGLLLICYVRRQRHPTAWLGALMFVAFLLPTLGLAPFWYQGQSTVADRYAYLSMIGIGLIVGDTVAAFRSNIAPVPAAGVMVALAIVSFAQTRYWVDNSAFLRHVADVNPQVAFAHNNLASILLRQHQPALAIEELDKARAIDPRDAKVENNLGIALLQSGRLEEAAQHYQRAVELDPLYFKAYENLGSVYLRIGRLDAAIASLKAALAIQPSEAGALNDLGVALMRSRRGAEGLDAFQRAASLEPDNREFRRNAGRALLQQGRADEARTYLTP